MRALPVLALALATAASGCLAGADASFAAGRDCSSETDSDVGGFTDILAPAEVPASRPQVEVEVRQGQTLVAIAVWDAGAGQAQAVFDGPTQHLVQTERTWTSTTQDAAAGTYTLSLEGAPLATLVSYSLMLTAAGCTPA